VICKEETPDSINGGERYARKTITLISSKVSEKETMQGIPSHEMRKHVGRNHRLAEKEGKQTNRRSVHNGVMLACRPELLYAKRRECFRRRIKLNQPNQRMEGVGTIGVSAAILEEGSAFPAWNRRSF